MRCLYCDKEINRYTLTSILLEEDRLCPECRRQLRIHRHYVDLGELKVECFFDYDGLFRSILLQYKECYDEALKDVFLYRLKEYIELKYHGYHLLYVPSSGKKRKERGFDHLDLIFGSVRLKKAKGLKMKEEWIQEGKDAGERYRMKDNYLFEGEIPKRILIVDDVVTTGSSILGVHRAVSTRGNIVKALSLANKSINFNF